MSEVLKSDLMEPEAETLVNKRNLYAPIEPYSTGNLKVSDVHTLYWEQSGKPDGHVRKAIIVILSLLFFGYDDEIKCVGVITLVLYVFKFLTFPLYFGN